MVPPIVTNVPPSVVPLAGDTADRDGGGAVETLIENPVALEFAFESCTFAVKEKLPAHVGVPAIVPPIEFSVSPVGSAPLVVLHTYGGTPPVAASVAL